ncbi:hypothetical protein Echvi_3075 [Echinicola vietnamensis DSM 17526]|uniref:Uncharacterized protein n=1 Tax=Echinicola vietnamensis (strain DSM 17526 / LMG 23754 / KMM 6221) TaxID=926556 RepID=L0G1W8_ECHVK|nr:hypothetical protein Echvi_3075 [Echinicola vietnamensis DSM 17526]
MKNLKKRIATRMVHFFMSLVSKPATAPVLVPVRSRSHKFDRPSK